MEFIMKVTILHNAQEYWGIASVHTALSTTGPWPQS